MKEHLTLEELLTALKFCKGKIGEGTCIGCPNAVPGSEDKNGLCECRYDNYEEMIYVLESILAEREEKV